MVECVLAGVNYGARELDKAVLKVDFYEGKILKDEYMGCMWPAYRLAPHNGRRVRHQVKRPGI